MCEVPVALKVCKRKGKGPQSNVGSIGAAVKPVAGTNSSVFAFIGGCLVRSICDSFSLLPSVAFSAPNFHKCSFQLALAVSNLRIRVGLPFLSVV